jgi:hypothetical protein
VNDHGVYLVTGPREYRGHKPGETFEAKLEPNVEHRAIRRGSIRLLRRVTPALVPGSYTLPDDWPPGREPSLRSTEAPEGASLI